MTSTTPAPQALANLQEHEVLMIDGHFDYGNGYHGRVYLNPHRIFRQPSLIWRFAQDLIDILPERSSSDGSRRRAGDGRRAARAHDGRAARRPAQPHASAVRVSRRSRPTMASALELRPFYQGVVAGKRVLLADDVRNTGKTFERAKAVIEQAGGTVIATVEICDRLEAIVDLGVPKIALAEYRAPENYPVAECPMCGAGRRHELLTSPIASAAERAARSALRRLQSSGVRARSDSGRPALRAPRGSGDRRIRRRGARVWPRGVGHGVHRSRLPGDGAQPAGFVRTFDPARDGAPFALVHRWTRGNDFVALLWICGASSTNTGRSSRRSLQD